MNPQTLTVEEESSDTSETTVFDGNISSIRLNGEELKTSHDIHGKISDFGFRLTEADKFFREQHRKTRADIAERDKAWWEWSIVHARRSIRTAVVATSVACVLFGALTWWCMNLMTERIVESKTAIISEQQKQLVDLHAELGAMQEDLQKTSARVKKLHLVRMKEHPMKGELLPDIPFFNE